MKKISFDKSCVEYGVASHNYNKRKVKLNVSEIAVQNSSMVNAHDEKGRPYDDSDLEEVENVPMRK